MKIVKAQHIPPITISGFFEEPERPVTGINIPINI